MNILLKALLILGTVSFLLACGGGEDVPPRVNITSPITDTTYTGGEDILIEFSVTDESMISDATVQSTLPGNASISVGRTSPAFGTVEYAIDPIAPAGQYTIEVLITDSEDNVGSDSLRVLILQ